MNRIEGPLSVVAGGDSNQILNIAADHNFIGGGLNNIEMNPSYGVISGGAYNYLDNDSWGSTIAGGYVDSVKSYLSFLGGGGYNTIEVYDNYSVLTGGERNRVWSNNAFLGGGRANFVHGTKGVLVGGDSNVSQSAFGVLGGGLQNVIDYNSDTAVLVGGAYNYINFGSGSFLGAGMNNSLNSPFSFLGGGSHNTIFGGSTNSLIGGGADNTLSSLWSSYHLMNWLNDDLDSSYAGGYNAIAGGRSNSVSSSYGSVLGGYENRVDTFAVFGTVAGGQYNVVGSPFSFVGGGKNNRVRGEAGDVIGGGWDNAIDGLHETKDFIGGGELNSVVLGCWSSISGGLYNTISSIMPQSEWNDHNTANFDFIGGGYGNEIDSVEYSAIGGGRANMITGSASFASIPGGDHLIAQSYAQTVIGKFNVAQGSSNTNTQDPNDRLFIVGNGTAVKRHNAFEIASSGLALDREEVSNGGTVVPGAHYKSNQIVAWADCPATTGIGSGLGLMTTNSDIGVASVTHYSIGRYDVVLNLSKDDLSGAYLMNGGSVVVTVQDAGIDASNCGFATVTPISNGSFTIHIHNNNCNLADFPFFFQVVGR